MKKKVVSMLLAAVVAIGAAGCGSDANTSTKTEGQADAGTSSQTGGDTDNQADAGSDSKKKAK